MAGDRSTASRWVMGFLIYFLVYFVAVYAITSANSEMGIVSGSWGAASMGSSGFVSTYALDSCDRPRCAPDNLACTASTDEASLSCQMINTNNVCSTTPDCTWLTTTNECVGKDTSWGQSLGRVNESSLYNLVYPPSDIGAVQRYSSLVGDYLLYNTSTDETISLASTPLLNSAQSICEGFGFTWYTKGQTVYQKLNPKMSVSEVTATIAAIFGFSANIGLPQEFSWIFVLLFTYIPLVAFALIIIMMVLP